MKSLVTDVIMPPIGLALGGVDFSDLFIVLKGEGSFNTVAEAASAGAVTINYGLFLNNVISFVIVAFAVFLLVKSINKMKKEEEEKPAEVTTKECPRCYSAVALKATRCPHCTSDIG